MGTFIFHNKYHRNAHHTVPTDGFPDSASDPIASEKYPFLGIFHNTLFEGINSNSKDWANTFTATSANSAVWENYLSVYTTVNTNSAFWQNNYPAYITYKSLSANIDSTYTTVSINSAFWNRLYSDETRHVDRSQEDTRQKNFKIFQVVPSDISNIILDLSAGQVSYYTISNTSNISGFIGSKRGGKYNFYVVTDGSCLSTIELNFNPNVFKFPSTTSFIITGTRLGKFEFLSDGVYLHGKGTVFDSIGANDQNTYFGASGVILNPNPYIFSNNEIVQGTGGLLIEGVYPYTAGEGVQIVYTAPCT